MIEVEVLGVSAGDPPGVLELQRLCSLTARRAGIEHAHVAVELVDAERIAELNAAHRGHAGPTDVLSFPIDGIEPLPVESSAADHAWPLGQQGAEMPRELGDIVICPEHTSDLREAVVHGMLHLLGMDHESDRGEMLSLQAELLREAEARP